MSLLKKLFGGSTSAPEAKTETYEGCTILPASQKESGGYRLGATIQKEIDGETKSHTLIRADTLQSLDEANEAAVRKAKQVIDEQGDRLFG